MENLSHSSCSLSWADVLTLSTVFFYAVVMSNFYKTANLISFLISCLVNSSMHSKSCRFSKYHKAIALSHGNNRKVLIATGQDTAHVRILSILCVVGVYFTIYQ